MQSAMQADGYAHRSGAGPPRAAGPADKPRYPWLYALPGARMPQRVRCAGQTYEHVETFKHDFFAATGLYRSERGELVVVKLGRQTDFLTVPLGWLGAWLTQREVRAYARLAHLRGVPRLIGCLDRHGLVHEFIPGHPLGRGERVGDDFFDSLHRLVRAVHARDMAYVDLNKRQNILVGDDGQPYLIDFQIALLLPPVGWRRLPPLRWVLARFQRGDEYHVLKHKRRSRPDLLDEQERRRLERLGIWIRLHRRLSRPLTQLRRRVLRRLEAGAAADVAGSHAA